ncbi:uncharacterized protein E0L32_002522 [Thyridium curvatum]|uniref:Uncharacterized protein n=1 Tax=Thyridium curvatum TaxID=1093900 RepID=A0A507B6B9_9PEZI|nr:uncharacterized protein E0L32_002522 [Thyridium curvatum]TPX18665.1 hypothetical protein E0L32_002522 [Thyridium curvatum]
MVSPKKKPVVIEDDSGWGPVKTLQKDLARRLRLHWPAIEKYWGSLTPRKQKECFDSLLPGLKTGLKNCRGRTLGGVLRYCSFAAEVSALKESPRRLLDILQHRASTTLLDQYLEGPNGNPGDREFAIQFVLKAPQMGIHLQDCFQKEYKGDTYTFFFDDENFGETRERMQGTDDLEPELQPLLDRGECVSEPFGYLVFERQRSVLRFLLAIVEDILLEAGEQSRCTTVSKTPYPYQTRRECMSEVLHTHSLTTFANVAVYSRGFLELQNQHLDNLKHGGYLELFVRRYFNNHPGLIWDEDGCVMPVLSDRFLSRALFQLWHESLQITAIWRYIHEVLELIVSQPASHGRQECFLSDLSTALQHSYVYHQSRLRKMIQINEAAGYFTRRHGQYDKLGNPVIVMKHNPQDEPECPRRLRCLVDLCRSKTTAPKALELLRDWDEHDDTLPGLDGGLYDEEFEALFDLIVAVVCSHSLHQLLPLPNPHLKREDSFAARFRKLEAEINALECEVDLHLQDFAAPTGNLREPGVAEEARQALDDFMVVKVGSTIQTAYDAIVEECLSAVRQAQAQANERSRDTETLPEPVKLANTQPPGQDRLPAPAQLPQPKPRASSAQPTDPQAVSKANKSQHGTENVYPLVAEQAIVKKPVVEPIIAKGKKHDPRRTPVENASKDLKPSPSQSDNSSNKKTEPPSEEDADGKAEARLKVSRSAKHVFDTLFAKSRRAQGAISWKNFGSAMVEAGFSVIPGTGSEFKFVPAPGSDLKASMVVHKPHQPGNSKKIEGSKASAVRRQLRRELGWDEDTFESK